MAEREIIDLFAGAGGWDEGLAHLGHAAFGIDGDPLACSTAEAAGHSRLLADVAEINPPDLAPIWGLIASPPCQAYSTSGKKLGRIDKAQVIACAHELAAGHDSRAERAAECRDARSLLTVEPLRWTVELRPRWIALEQVPPVLELWSLFASLLSVHGYESAVGVLSAERYGVPQTRRRAFLIASLDGPVKLPEPTHRSYSARRAPGRIPEDEVGLLPWVSMAEALGWSGVTATTCTHNQTNHGQRPRGHERSVDRPARTIDSASGSWTIEPLPGDGHDPAAALPPWVEDRPATTVIGSARVAAPTALDRDPDWKPGDPWPSQWKGSVRITPSRRRRSKGSDPTTPGKARAASSSCRSATRSARRSRAWSLPRRFDHRLKRTSETRPPNEQAGGCRSARRPARRPARRCAGRPARRGRHRRVRRDPTSHRLLGRAEKSGN